MEIKTTMTTCPNGHHYDSAKNRTCPYCGSAGSFSHTEPLNSGAGSFGHTEPLSGGTGSFGHTEPLNGGASSLGRGESFGGSGNFGATEPPESRRNIGGPMSFSSETMIGGDKVDGDQNDPVVGWLVCIEGPVRGNDYRIHAGYNYIGRETGDVRIHGDQTISRQNHAMIAYDSSDRTYFVGPSAGRNLIKVNGKTVLNAVEVKNYDVISIGSTKMMFVALCSEKFNWETREPNNG